MYGWRKLECSRLIPVLEHVGNIGLLFNRWKFGSGCVDVAVVAVCFHYHTAVATCGDPTWVVKHETCSELFPTSSFKITFHRITCFLMLNLTGTWLCSPWCQGYQGVCDKDGCDFNSWRLGDQKFYGRGARDFKVDSRKKVTVVTQFITEGRWTGCYHLGDVEAGWCLHHGNSTPNEWATLNGHYWGCPLWRGGIPMRWNIHILHVSLAKEGESWTHLTGCILVNCRTSECFESTSSGNNMSAGFQNGGFICYHLVLLRITIHHRSFLARWKSVTISTNIVNLWWFLVGCRPLQATQIDHGS